MSKSRKGPWASIQNSAESIASVFFLLGIAVLIVLFVLLVSGSQPNGELIGVMLGLFSVGLACIAIVLSKKADKKYTVILNKMNRNIENLRDVVVKRQDTIKQPSGDVVVTPLPAELRLKTYPPEVKIEKKRVEKESKEAAQKRLDEDTRKVGFVRGEIYQLEDGSWGIHWGGKYPL